MTLILRRLLASSTLQLQELWRAANKLEAAERHKCCRGNPDEVSDNFDPSTRSATNGAQTPKWGDRSQTHLHARRAQAHAARTERPAFLRGTGEVDSEELQGERLLTALRRGLRDKIRRARKGNHLYRITRTQEYVRSILEQARTKGE